MALAVWIGVAPAAPPPEVPSPASHARLAADFLSGRADRQHLRLFSWLGVPELRLTDFKRVFAWWMNQLSFDQGVSLPQDVPGGEGRLQWVDIRDYRWNVRAFRAVAERDTVFQEPWVPSSVARRLRRLVDVGVTAAVWDSGRYPAEAIVWAPQFFRDTVETDRVSSYYDLLFARQRHGRNRQRNFPANDKDLEKAIGVDLIRAFAKEASLDLDYGAIVPGGDDDPVNGSIVARNNRVLVFLPIPTTLPGWYGRTFDVTETAGDKDFTEQLIFKGGKFKRGDGAKAVFDAGEILFSLPNGGQGGMLINGQGKRVEVADNKVAKDTSDTRMDARVRTLGSCVICHGPSGGFIYPKDTVVEMLKTGVEIKFKDKAQRNRILAFLNGWQKRAKTFTLAYEELVTETTKDAKGVAWTPTQLAAAFQDFRDWYDSPVPVEQAAAESGVSAARLKAACYRSPKARLQRINRGLVTPRKAWEKGVFREVNLLLSTEK